MTATPSSTQARRAIHDNDVERLDALLTDCPALLSWQGTSDTAVCSRWPLAPTAMPSGRSGRDGSHAEPARNCCSSEAPSSCRRSRSAFSSREPSVCCTCSRAGACCHARWHFGLRWAMPGVCATTCGRRRWTPQRCTISTGARRRCSTCSIPHLHCRSSVVNRHFEVAEFLLDHGADIDTDWNSHEPASILHHLVFLLQPYESMRFLIDHGIDTTMKDYRWQSTAAGWARYGKGDEQMAGWLEDAARRRHHPS